MLTTSLLALTLALPPSGAASHWQLSLRGDFTHRHFTEPVLVGQPIDGTTLQGGGAGGVSFFPRALVDDDAAPSLQPFLQRATIVSLDGHGYGFHMSAWPLGPNGRDGSGGGASASATGYAAPWMRWHLALGAEYDRYRDVNAVEQTALRLPIELSLGARHRDLLGYVGWHVEPRRIGHGDFGVPYWGGAYIGGEAVLARRIDLLALVQILDGGANARGDVTLWLARRFGVDLGVFGGHGRVEDSPTTEDDAGARLALTGWFVPRVGATLEYSGSWYRYRYDNGAADTNGATHVISLALVARPH